MSGKTTRPEADIDLHGEPSARKSSLTDRAYGDLQRRIVHLELAPGDTFAEGEIAAQLGMSKTPVREALLILQTQGFVKASPRAGWTISPITLRDAQQLYAMRRLLEPESTRLAVQRGLCDQHVRQLKKLSEMTVDPSDRESLDTFLEAYGHVPVIIAGHSGNERLMRSLHDVCVSLERLFRLAVKMFEPQEKITEQWRQLVSVLLDGDVDKAVALVESNIAEERRMVLDALLESDAIQQTNVSSMIVA